MLVPEARGAVRWARLAGLLRFTKAWWSRGRARALAFWTALFVGRHLDRTACGRDRYKLTRDGLVVAGSESASST